MSRDLEQVFIDVIDDAVVYPFYAVELRFDVATLYMWTGIGDLVYQGNTYVGAGQLLKVSSIEETSDISAKGATLTLSGVDSTLLTRALTEPYQGRIGKIFFGLLSRGDRLQKEDSDYILLQSGDKILLNERRTSLSEIFSGYMDQMSIDENPTEPMLILTLENKLIDLERTRVFKYTSADQKKTYPNDLGFDYVEAIQNKVLNWG